ncbi:MAG: FAD-dependent oxidoreductase [Oscillospiraceae bacterium]|nr:FAD-dependent oxidoreductase [Oscillospiraceae bacterium]
MYERLLTPLKIGGITVKNRMFSSPTSLAELGPEEHYSKENIEYYKLRALGGAAVVPVGDVIVDLDTGRSHPQQVGINDPSAAPYLCAVADAIHAGGAMASVEIDHGGALCAPEFIGGKCAFGPSGYIDPWGDEVKEMTEEQMYWVADKFAEGARNARDFGFDMVMLHGGHGWLLHQFLSPVTNHRTDKWGGSLENRMRFPLLVIEKIRAAVGRQFPIEIRISGTEYIEGGYGPEEGVEIAKMLDGKVDLIHVSAGTQQEEYSAVLMHPGAFQKDMFNGYLAAEIKKHVKTPVLTVGAFNMPDDMEKFLADTGVDAIAMGRALIADPFLPRKVMEGKPEEITPCIRCTECQSGMMKNRVIRCSVNPYIGRECDVFHPLPTYVHKKILIAGGGPAGMEAALLGVERGHQVVLCEASDRLGALRFADNDTWFKEPMRRYRDSQAEKVMRCGAEVRLNTKVTKEIVDEVKPDVLIAAVGGEPFGVPVPGADGPNVIFGAYITPQTEIGKSVVIIGGGFIGCEEAVDLASKGHDVVILEMIDTLAANAARMHRIGLMHEIETRKNITQATGMRCTKIDEKGVYALDKDGKEVFFPCDTVVMASGMRSRSAEVEALRPLVKEFYVIGDARKAAKIMNGTHDAYDAIVTLGYR